MYTDEEIKSMLKDIVILVDKREKVNNHITDYFDKYGILYEYITLDSGDYSFMLKKNIDFGIMHDMYFDSDIIIERKNSLEELSSCFTQTRDRFNAEWCRCRAARKHLLIENSSYHDLINGNYNTKYNSKSFLGSLHSFEAKYDLHVMFMPDKQCSATYILATFQYYLRFLIK